MKKISKNEIERRRKQAAKAQDNKDEAKKDPWYKK